MSIVIGITYNDGTLTLATRRGRAFLAIEQHANVTDGEAEAKLYDLANRYSHEQPITHVTGNDAARFVEQVRAHAKDLPILLFDWRASTNNSAFANAGSEAFHRLIDVVNKRNVSLPKDDATIRELAAFSLDEDAGDIRYFTPGRVAESIDRYPARALAILMAHQHEAAPRVFGGSSDSMVGHDPFRSLGRP